jgi:hypothetical protein
MRTLYLASQTQRFVRALATFIVGLGLCACIGHAQIVEHSFSFDAISDSPDVEVLDYRYGDSKQPMARNPEYLLKEGRSLQRTSINGEMLRGDFLYVKWRVKSTGQAYEDNVDLRQRLPPDITEHRIHFIIRGPQLYVYLVTPQRRPPDVAPNGPRPYQYLRTITIYPDQAKQ